jgi:signal transduction histidine kinase
VVVATIGGTVILGSGWVAELWRFGPTTNTSFARVDRAVVRSVDEMAASLERTASLVAADAATSIDITSTDTQPLLFNAIRSAIANPGNNDISVTVYDAGGSARAWAGRPSEIPSNRVLDDESYFVVPGLLGLRLVYVHPLRIAEEMGGVRRLGSVAVERLISPTGEFTQSAPSSYQFTTPLVDVLLRTVYDGRDSAGGPFTIEIQAPSGELLLEGQVREEDLTDARMSWRRSVAALTLGFLAFVLAVAFVPLIVRPRRSPSLAHIAAKASVAGLASLLGYGLLRVALNLGFSDSKLALFDPEVHQSVRLPTLIRSPAELLLFGLVLVGLCLIGVFVIEQTRLVRHQIRQLSRGLLPSAWFVVHTVGGVGVAVALVGLDLLIRDTFDSTAVDLLHTSLHPWDSGRVAMLVGMLLASVAIVWGCVAFLLSTQLPWRLPPRARLYIVSRVAAWTLPGAVLVGADWVPVMPFVAMLAGSIVLAAAIPFLRPRFRHASHATRVMTLFLALLLPALLVYPSLLYHGERTKQRFIETQYAVQAASHSEQLQAQLTDALGQIDAISELLTIISVDDFESSPLNTDRAFSIWRQTDLSRLRLTSAVEVYDADGQLKSRFALNFPEYSGRPSDSQVTGCDWEVYGEIAPFGSDERRVLHAERAVCLSESPPGADETSPPSVGAVVVHVAFDYQTLPFISSTNPYTELLRPPSLPNLEGRTGQDVELVIYGWGLQPLFSSGRDAWTLGGNLFEQIHDSRDPFWTSLLKGDRQYTTYVANNRVGIYLLGYPAFNLFEHFIHLAELFVLAGLIFVVLGAVVGAGSWFIPDRYRFGRALLREVRTSFYRRLLLAFIAATLIPVLALAFVIRGYFTAELRADVEAGAARTASIAQRVIEESFVLQQIGEEATAPITDDLLVWISQVLDQEINIFNGSQLVATSERDLFASGLLPTRTPDAVYSAVILNRMPSYVMEDSLASLQYLVAATPIPAAGRDAVLTVPLAPLQQEIERQIDELDRGLLLGVILFVLAGAASGLYMAERIADPVKRLTRATEKIARGDFNAHIAARSADELQQLVMSFNQMAIDLKSQQIQLEKTHRLEAWADMARQIAHEIKNPLTPVQLSAEHLLRVHTDRGEPLGPVLRACVESILSQVRLLRQISSEFSSYASSPIVKLRPLSLRELVIDVLEPYLVGLEQRVSVSVDIPKAIPKVELDRTLVARAIANIIENALHAMPGRGSLKVHTNSTLDTLALKFVDTGVGLDAETLEHVFEPYFSTKISGTGLGMAIAKRNIELSGGTIEVESEKHRGTTVTLQFRLR